MSSEGNVTHLFILNTQLLLFVNPISFMFIFNHKIISYLFLFFYYFLGYDRICVVSLTLKFSTRKYGNFIDYLHECGKC